MTELPTVTEPSLPATPSIAKDADAANTKRAYRTDLADFREWGGTIPAVPELVGAYLEERARRYSLATLQRRLIAIARAHRHTGERLNLDHPAIRETWRAIRRHYGKPQDAKAPLLTEDIRAIMGALPNTLAGKRDAALLLIGFASALRRSELVALTVEDVTFARQGAILMVRRSKTDQAGEGRKVAIPNGKPVEALREWLDVAAITTGAIFRRVDKHGHIGAAALSTKAVANIVKRSAEAVGIDPARVSGHSLRAGHATAAAQAGASEREIMAQTGHSTTKMVRRYIRDGRMFEDNSAGKLGL